MGAHQAGMCSLGSHASLLPSSCSSYCLQKSSNILIHFHVGMGGADGDSQPGSKKARTDQANGEAMETEAEHPTPQEDPKKEAIAESAGNPSNGHARGEGGTKRRAAQEGAKRLKETGTSERLSKSELVELKEEPECESEAVALQETGSHGSALKRRSVPLPSRGEANLQPHRAHVPPGYVVRA